MGQARHSRSAAPDGRAPCRNRQGSWIDLGHARNVADIRRAGVRSRSPSGRLPDTVNSGHNIETNRLKSLAFAITLTMAAQPSIRAALATEPKDDSYRSPPHNLEAEQALLGAILVNNEHVTGSPRSSSPRTSSKRCMPASTRRRQPSSALASSLRRSRQDLFRARRDAQGNRRPCHISSRLAAAATTIINAEEYGRAIYELAQRRKLIAIGTEVVNNSFDTPVDTHTRATLSSRPSRASMRLRDRQIRAGLPAIRARAHRRGRHGCQCLSARWRTVGDFLRPQGSR